MRKGGGRMGRGLFAKTLSVCLSANMLVRALLQTSLVLWLVQSTIQGGVRPQTGSLGRLASRGPGVGVKSGVAGILGARGYGAGKPGKTGGAAYRPAPIRGGLKQGYGTLGYGGGYTSNGYGAQLGYGAGGYPAAGRGYGVFAGTPTGQGSKASKLGYGLGAAGYLGAGLTDGYGAGLGAGGYPQGVRAGKQIAGYSNGYGSEVYGTADGYGAGPAYPSMLADNGLNGVAGLAAGSFGGLGGPGMVVNPGLGADAKSRKYGAGGVLGAAGSLPYGGQPVVSAGLGPQGKSGSYGGAAFGGIPTLGPETSLGGAGGAMEPLAGGAVGQIPYSAPVIAAGLDVDAGYPFGAEQLSLGADATKTAAKYGTGYAAALSAGGQGPYGGQKDGSKLSGIYGNGYKG
ncbi:glycine-rich cell wall structural -like protein [Labeo rohita]|uniref:Glycine-rich cell wall structural-like protein n=1 Tax=Labeo rohita TaxID=84645 RepID=A0A498LB63_LABRO|nr:glycine-rich cell wall structural -like protein [Labeo rohita]